MSRGDRGRRRYLRALGAVGTAVAAGCLAAGDPADDANSRAEGGPSGGQSGGQSVDDGPGTTGPGTGGTDGSVRDSLPTDTADAVEVTDHLANQTHFTRYGAASVDATVFGWPTFPHDPVRVACYTMAYPRGRIVASGASQPFDPPSGDPVDVHFELDRGSIPEGVRLHHALRAIPADETAASAPVSERYLLAETDPFAVRDGRIGRSPPDHELGPAPMSTFGRRPVEGAYDLTFSGRTAGRTWSTSMYVYKSAYSVARRRSMRENDTLGYGDYVTIAHENGNAVALARALATLAERNGFAGTRETTNFAVDFVQSLPYTADDVSKGFDEYPRFPTETLVEGGGDCEDTTVLLVSVLEADPFGHDAAMIGPPGHMGAGIHGEDLSGAYWEYDGRRYYYVETTGDGWRIGEVPEQYRGTEARIWQVP